MPNVTLDTNCIIELEENRSEAPYIRTLICLHNDKQINLRVVGISASERKPNGTYASNFAEFKRKITAVGLGHVEILKPMGRVGVTYWDWCVAGDQQMIRLQRRIFEILFTKIEYEYKEFCRQRRIDPNNCKMDAEYRNAMCDVVALWSHIYYGGGIFVTEDSNFHKKSKNSKLMALGAGGIVRAKEAVARLMSDAQSK